MGGGSEEDYIFVCCVSNPGEVANNQPARWHGWQMAGSLSSATLVQVLWAQGQKEL